MIPEPALQIFYRLGDSPDWIDTGVGSYTDPRTGKPAANSNIELPEYQEPTTIHLKYINANGQEMGPFEFQFVTTSALVEEHKRIAEMTWTSWIAIQPNPGNPSQMLAYYTGLVSWRCAVAKAMYSIDSTALDQELKLPPCDEKDPNSIPSDFLPYFEVASTIKSITLQVSYKDGTQSAVREYRPR
jgi:hypothetical protein